MWIWKGPAPQSWARMLSQTICFFWLECYIGKCLVRFFNIFKISMLKSPAHDRGLGCLHKSFCIFCMGYRKECCKIFGYIQNLNFKKSGPTIVGLDAFTNHVFGWMLYRQVSCKIVEYIENVNVKKSGPTIVGPDALATQNLIVS